MYPWETARSNKAQGNLVTFNHISHSPMKCYHCSHPSKAQKRTKTFIRRQHSSYSDDKKYRGWVMIKLFSGKVSKYQNSSKNKNNGTINLQPQGTHVDPVRVHTHVHTKQTNKQTYYI